MLMFGLALLLKEEIGRTHFLEMSSKIKQLNFIKEKENK